MIIKNGIAYAENAAPMLKLCGVRPMNDYKLWVRFNTGEAKIFDCTPLLSKPAFAPLADLEVFKDVYIDYGVPTWLDGEIDIAPEVLYEKSVPAESPRVS